jgi:sulfur carrier protein ThiS
MLHRIKINMKVRILYHGELRRYNDGRSEAEMELSEGTTVGQLISRTDIPRELIAFAGINGSRVDKAVTLKDGDEVTLFQIVAGG